MRVALVLPMYNEEKSIEMLRNDTLKSTYVDHIITVDDGSTDNTLKCLLDWSEKDKRVTIVSYNPNRGLPGAVQAGFVEALELGADVIITMDSDGSHPVDLIPLMIDRISQGYDIVIASRHAPGATQVGLSYFRRLLSWGASLLMRMAFPIGGLQDYSTNYRAYRSLLIKDALGQGDGKLADARDFSGVVEMLLRLCSLSPRIAEVPLDLDYGRKASESKARILRIIRGYLRLVSMPKIRSAQGVSLPFNHSHTGSV